MNYEKWTEHVHECLYARVFDTEAYESEHERGLPGIYYDVVWDEHHDDKRLTDLDDMVLMDMRNGSMGEYRYSEVRKVFDECGIYTKSWSDDYCMERYRLLMERTLRYLAEFECVVRGYGGYATSCLVRKYV